MISIDITIREAVAIASSASCSQELYDRIVKAIDVKCDEGHGCDNTRITPISGEQQERCVIIKSVGCDNRLEAIRAIRCVTGWSHKWVINLVDDVMAWHRSPGTGRHRSLILPAEKGYQLVAALQSLKVDACIHTYTDSSHNPA